MVGDQTTAPTAVLWDMDGTLVDTEPYWMETEFALAAEYGGRWSHELALELVAAGYERVDRVEDRGQFATRGDILDVFPATGEHAVRVELFDIEIESIRRFSSRQIARRQLKNAKTTRNSAWKMSAVSNP